MFYQLNLKIIFTRFRCRNFNIPVEKGSYFNIPLASRTCDLCGADDIGDEFHYLFTCRFFCNERKKSFKQYYFHNPSVHTLCNLLNSKGHDLLNVCRFLVHVKKYFD